MEVKDLQREVSDAERLAERGRMVLELNQKVADLMVRLQVVEQENEAMKESIAVGAES
jgi:hypothetical protein